MSENPYRNLPSVDRVLQSSLLASSAYPHERQLRAVRAILEELRSRLRADDPLDAVTQRPDSVAKATLALLAIEDRPNFRRVINATGIVLHTNLGRSVLADLASRAAHDAASGYLNLEIDLVTGKRASRQDPLRPLLQELTGGEAATAVNNCAAATVITLRALAMGREVIVSRGQLVEIGGSFRIPEIMAVSGATLREVGTTNITRVEDYEAAIGPNTAALMLIHQSNFRIRGFTHSATLEELVSLGQKYQLPVIDDCGSGAMLDFARFGLAGEPVIPERIRAGADVVLFSGDKLLGGPQAGLILGGADWIHRIERDPLMRAFRLDKMTLAALEATLRLYRDEARALAEIPTLRMANMSIEELRRRATALAERLRPMTGLDVTIIEDETYIGGGSIPDEALPAIVVGIRCEGLDEERFAAHLRLGEPAVLTRVRDGRVWIDPRTILPEQENDLMEAIHAVRSSSTPAESARS